ncbi:uncharacterized protein LOC118463914 isoform X2 [Anopheles albimanus]|uniref:uncharacterized protein LOC118463914 isoform X2 n=1 Tax=Anopheles albimanus TaxID=7167 RepID=UPI00163EFD36|nr:uncharacterized protein LOC118463914 isoform X2 [Anopheles albimanus]
MYPVSEMQREERNAALRKMAEDKITFIDKQSSKLCSASLTRFQKLMGLFSNIARIKSDNILKAIDQLTKLEAEVSVKTEMQVAEKQVKMVDSVIEQQNIPQTRHINTYYKPHTEEQHVLVPQLAEPSGNNSGIRSGHTKVSIVPVASHLSSATNTYSKPHTEEDTLRNEIFQMASSYHPQPIESSSINEERLSLKYPRKKKNPGIESTDSSSVFKTPAIPEKRGDDKLFFRRAEVFPAPPKTYAEHRIRKANEMSMNNHQFGGGFHRKSPSPSKNYVGQNSQPPPNNYQGFGPSTQTNTANAKTGQSSSSSNVLLAEKSTSTPGIPIPNNVKHGVTIRNYSPQPLSKPVQQSTPSDQDSTAVTENTLSSSAANHVELSNKKLGNSSPTKKGQNILNREVHSLIVGQIEFTESLNRKKENEKLRNISNHMESVKDRQKNQDWERDLLKKYGMLNETRVLLTRLEDDNGIALRTRAKSTENREFSYTNSSNSVKQRKKSPSANERITKRRKTVDCREALENPSRTNKNREQAKSRKSKCRRKSYCSALNSVTVTPEKTVQNSLYLSDNEDNDNEPPKKKQVMNNRKSKSNRDTAKQTCSTNTKSKNKVVASSTTRESSGAKTSVSLQGSSIIDKHVDIPNDNPDIHCQSNFMSSCSLCSYRGGEMVDHYLSKHNQNEVFVSRISPRQSDTIRKFPIPLHVNEKIVSKNGRDRLTRFCCFCEKNCVLTHKEWIKHIAQHTGEYEFEKEEKAVKKPFAEIKFQNNNILAYICDRCNYVQTRFSAMENHLEKQHFSLNDGSSNTMEYIRFAVCRAKGESTSVENKTNYELKPEPMFGAQVINNPIDKDEESTISDGVDHEILQELERLHGYEPLVDSIVKEEIDLNSDAELINQCGKKGSKPTEVALHNKTSTNILNNVDPDCTAEQRLTTLQTTSNKNVVEIIREPLANEVTAVRDNTMEYDSDDSLSTIAMDDPEYQHSMGGIKEEEFADEFRKSSRDNPLQCDKNIDQNQASNVVPLLNLSMNTENGDGSCKIGQNIISSSCVKAEIMEAACGTNEENNVYNESNEIQNESIALSPIKKTTCTVIRSNNGGSYESPEIQENRPDPTIVDAIVEQTPSNPNPFEIVRNEEHWQYLCRYSTNCKFVGSNAISLEKHVETKHSAERWSGYCHSCEYYITSPTGLTQQFAIDNLKHFLLYHSDTKPASQLGKSLTIRLRRLSGDKLSVVNN